MKVAQYFGHNHQRVSLLRHPMVLGTNCVGVEVELENVIDWDMNSDYWVIKEDGSLRNNGREFVFRGPTGGKDLYNALVELDTFLGERNPDGNWRCSTHMHLDVRDMNAKSLKMMILAYLVSEKALFRLAAMHRYTNNFCAAIGFAQEQLQILSNAWGAQDIGDFWRKLEGWNKYSALNLLPMHNFGSVEFRMSDAKWRKNDLLLLCNRFLALKELAMHWEGSEEELVAYMVNTPIHEVFPKGIPVDMPADFLAEDMAVGHKLAFDLLTFQAVAANVVREPVEMPEIRGGNGQWNNIDNAKHAELVHFMVRAGLPANQINQALYDGAEGDDRQLAPAMKINSHVVSRHMWSLYLQLTGHRIPNNVDLPKYLPTGVVRRLLEEQYVHVIGLFPQELVMHLMTPDQRDRLNNGGNHNHGMFGGAAEVRLRGGMRNAGRPMFADIGAAPAAMEWQVAQQEPEVRLEEDEAIREDEDFEVAAEEPF